MKTIMMISARDRQKQLTFFYKGQAYLTTMKLKRRVIVFKVTVSVHRYEGMLKIQCFSHIIVLLLH